MKLFLFLAFLLAGIYSLSAQDMIVMRDGNIIEAKVLEIHPHEIRYKRYNHLDGPTIVIPIAWVLSIRYENGTTEIFNAGTAATMTVQENVQDDIPETVSETPAGLQIAATLSDPRPGIPVSLTHTLNRLPAVPVAGNNLKFEFGTGIWIAKVNGRNFLEGTITAQDTEEGVLLILKQTHTYIRERRVGAPGPDIVLEYKSGPPASLSLVPGSGQPAVADSGQRSVRADRPESTAIDPDKLTVGFNFNLGGFLLYGPSASMEFNKNNFYMDINLIFPSLGLVSDSGFGGLITFNHFAHKRNGGFYIGGGMGYVYETETVEIYNWTSFGPIHKYEYIDRHTFQLGFNIGYKFVRSPGLSFRIGSFLGLGLGTHTHFYFKPDIAVGVSF